MFKDYEFISFLAWDSSKAFSFRIFDLIDGSVYFESINPIFTGSFSRSLSNYNLFTSDLFAINPIKFNYLGSDIYEIFSGYIEFKIKSICDKFASPVRYVTLDTTLDFINTLKIRGYKQNVYILNDLQSFYSDKKYFFEKKEIYLKHLTFRDKDFIEKFLIENRFDIDVLLFAITMRKFDSIIYNFMTDSLSVNLDLLLDLELEDRIKQIINPF